MTTSTMPHCPNCHRIVDCGCSDPDCVCHTDYDPEDMLIDRMLLFGKLVLPDRFGNWLWKALWKINIPAQNLIVEIRECPHCGYRMGFGRWEDLYYG